MTTPNFKKGQWLISRWGKDNAYKTCLCRFERKVNKVYFTDTMYFEINRRGKSLFVVSLYENKFFIDRKSLQWRPATKAELKKYSSLIFR